MISLVSALSALRRHGPTLGAVADLAVRARADQTVLVDADGPATGAELGRLMADIELEGEPGLLRVPGRHHRSTIATLLAATSAGWDVVVVNPAIERGNPPAAPRPRSGSASQDVPRGRLWLGTSGTTGTSQRHARRRYGPRLALPVQQIWRRWELGRPGSLLVEPPLHHGHGLGFTLLGLVAGRTVLLAEGPDHRDHLLADHRPAVTVSVPTQLARLRPTPGWQPRTMITGSGPLSPELQTAVIERFGPVLHNLFGSTEAGFATMATPADLALSPGSVGRPLTGVRVRVVDGLVEVNSPFATVPGPWVATGDRGRIDGHGLLHLLGRADDIIVVNGQNLTLEGIRSAVLAHPEVLEAQASAVSDPVSGHRVTVRVQLAGGITTDVEPLEQWVRNRIGVAVSIMAA